MDEFFLKIKISFSNVFRNHNCWLGIKCRFLLCCGCNGLRPFSKKDAFKFALSSGGAEALVTLIGAMAGLHLISKIESFDHWIAYGLLMGVALHMAYEGFCDLMSKEVKAEKLGFHSFTKVLIVSFATSLDAFGVGIGLGVAEKPITPYVFSIGIWAFIFG